MKSRLPTTAWLVVNYACNLSCTGCYVADANKQKIHMDLMFAKGALNELARIGIKTCILIGGEPTIHPFISEIVEIGNGLGIRMRMVSNGMALKNETLVSGLKEAGISGVAVSIEGSTAETHDSIRGEGSFSHSMRGLELCLKHGILSNSILTIASSNHNEIVPLARKMAAMGVKRILYNFLIPPSASKDPKFGTDPRSLAEVAISAYLKLKSEGIAVSFFGTLPLCLFGKYASEMSADDYMPLKTTCHMFSSQGIVIEPRGSIIPCTHFPGIKLFETTSDGGKTFALTGKLDEIWMDPEGTMPQFRDKLWTYPSSTCSHCSMWGKCLGGCPLLWNTYDPTEYLTGFATKNAMETRA